jgi:hypothetical protein
MLESTRIFMHGGVMSEVWQDDYITVEESMEAAQRAREIICGEVEDEYPRPIPLSVERRRNKLIHS